MPKDEVQVYTWNDATLRELTYLVGSTFPYGHGRGDDAKSVVDLGFQIGDYLSVSIQGAAFPCRIVVSAAHQA